MKATKAMKEPPAKAKKGSMQFVLANMDKFVTSKHTQDGMHEFNLSHYDLEIDDGWVRLRMKPETKKKLKK